MLDKVISICGPELQRRMQENPEKTFQTFKKYFVAINNIYKMNSQDRQNDTDKKYTYEDIKNIPPSVSPELYEKYREEQLKEKGEEKKEIDGAQNEDFMDIVDKLSQEEKDVILNHGRFTQREIIELSKQNLGDTELLERVNELTEKAFIEFEDGTYIY